MRWAMAGVAVTVVVADEVTKSLVAAGRIADGSTFGWVTVRVVRNHGASGGIAQYLQGVLNTAFRLHPEHQFVVFCTEHESAIIGE